MANSAPHQAVLKTRAWQQVRKGVLARDPDCTIRGRGCTGTSTQVDHTPALITLWRAHGNEDTPAYRQAALDPHHLRGACSHCNGSNGGRLARANDKRRKPRTPSIRSRDW